MDARSVWAVPAVGGKEGVVRKHSRLDRVEEEMEWDTAAMATHAPRATNPVRVPSAPEAIARGLDAWQEHGLQAEKVFLAVDVQHFELTHHAKEEDAIWPRDAALVEVPDVLSTTVLHRPAGDHG